MLYISKDPYAASFEFNLYLPFKVIDGVTLGSKETKNTGHKDPKHWQTKIVDFSKIN